MRRIITYLNPISRLGNTHYSLLFPFFANLGVCIASEGIALGIAKNPQIVGTYIIFANVALILYFAFRDGIRGGIVSALFAISYYGYIIASRDYSGTQLNAAINTTVILGVIYLSLASLVGWLKQRIDRLIEIEADARKRLETIIDQLPVGVIITDNVGRIVQRNNRLDEILDMRLPIGFTIGKDKPESGKIDGKEVKPETSPLRRALISGKPIYGEEMLFERKDGTRLSLQVSSTPIQNARGVVIAAASIVSDITKQKELERQKDEFLGIASHELKTPVTSIKAYAQVLERMFRERGETRSAAYLRKLDSQVDRLTNLISDLLDVTKIRSGRLQFNDADFDLNAAVEETVEDLRHTSGKHRIELKMGKPVQVNGDRERIGQVVTNLITNAIKYSPHEDRIEVETRKNKGEVIVSVRDRGIGIAEEDREKVFEQFYRSGGSTEQNFPGLGLGLYISAEIVRRHGGRIWVESTPGNGSTFRFALPLATIP